MLTTTYDVRNPGPGLGQAQSCLILVWTSVFYCHTSSTQYPQKIMWCGVDLFHRYIYYEPSIYSV
jgi:hypothetical protein